MGVNLKQSHPPRSVKFSEVPVRIIARQLGWKLHASFPRQRSATANTITPACGVDGTRVAVCRGSGAGEPHCEGVQLRIGDFL